MFAVIIRAAAAATVVLAAAACSGGASTPSSTAAATTAPSAAPTTAAAAASSTQAAPSAAITVPDVTADRAAVRKVFGDYNAALLARDFTTACSLTAPQAAEELIKALSAQGADVTTCEQGFAAVYAVPEASTPLDQAARSSTIQDVAIAGDTATVTYSGEAGGQRREGLTNKMQRIDGRWRLLGNGA